MKLLTMQTLPRYEERTDEWLPSPEFKVARKDVLAVASLVPFVIFSILFSYLPGASNPLFGDALMLLLAAVVTLPLHELCHAVAHPGWGLTSKTRFGLDANVGPFCLYTAPIGLERFQLVALTPFILLTLLPVAAQCFGYGCDFVRSVAAINASAATMDILMVVWLRNRLPAKCLITADGAQGLYRPTV